MVRPLTNDAGRYRVSRAYAGPGYYDAEVLKTRTTAGAFSRTDVLVNGS